MYASGTATRSILTYVWRKCGGVVPSNAAVPWCDCEFGCIRWPVGIIGMGWVVPRCCLQQRGVEQRPDDWGSHLSQRFMGACEATACNCERPADVMFMLGGLACAGLVLSGSHLSVMRACSRHVFAMLRCWMALSDACVSPSVFRDLPSGVEVLCLQVLCGAPGGAGARAAVVGLLCNQEIISQD